MTKLVEWKLLTCVVKTPRNDRSMGSNGHDHRINNLAYMETLVSPQLNSVFVPR